jgi:hypothetical protein
MEIESLKTEPWSFVWTLETNTSSAQEFLKICTHVYHVISNTLYFGSVV